MEMLFRELSSPSGISPKRLLEILSQAREFSHVNGIKGQRMPTNRAFLDGVLGKSLQEAATANGTPYERPRSLKTDSSVKAHALLFSHVHRIDLPIEGFDADRAEAVVVAMRLLQGVNQIAIAREWYPLLRHSLLLSQVYNTTISIYGM